MSMQPSDYDRGWIDGHNSGYDEGRRAEQDTVKPDAKPLTVLFSRHHNDFLHVYEMSNVPGIGQSVALLQSPFHSYSTVYRVKDVQWTPDHTRFDVTVVLDPVLKEEK